ncbi:MAG: Uma2 family endonuclease [Jatrophihabitans sp.]|uniref:Uma2 family endonuclease n=1 Tax=Jatrophihabitans sp. TaxID=1932789 RepID=UPI003F80D3B7
MTALTQPPGRLLTVAEFAALGEDDRHRWELHEGNLVMTPSPTPRHMVAVAQLYSQLHSQLPADLTAVPDVDLDLQLAPEGQPGTARRPDLVVVRRAEFERVDRDGGLLRAAATLLVVEVVSPGSRRVDTLVKRREYADAGVPHYWIIDLNPRPTLLACRLGDGSSDDAIGPVTRSFLAREPFEARVDLDDLGA